MHYTGAGKIQESEIIAEAVEAEDASTAPGPATFHRIYNRCHGDCEDDECPQLHALGHRTGHDRHGGSDKHYLEKEIGGCRVDCPAIEAILRRTGQRVRNQRFTTGNAGEEIAAAVHDLVTHRHVHDAGHREQDDILGQYLGGVFGTHQPGFEHGETRRHPHHQCATDEKVKSIDCVLQMKNLILHIISPKALQGQIRPYEYAQPVPGQLQIFCRHQFFRYWRP